MHAREAEQEKVAIIGDLLMGAAKGLGLHIGANAGIIGREAAAHSAIRPGLMGARRPTAFDDAAAFKTLQKARRDMLTPPKPTAWGSIIPDKLRKRNEYGEAKRALGLGKGTTEPLNITGGKGSAAPSGFFGGIGSKIQDADARAVQRGMVDVLAGKPMGIGSAIKKNLVATELGVPEDIGRIAGEQLRGKTPHQQKQLLKRVRKAIALNPEFRNQPQVEPVFRAANNILTEGVGNLPIKDQWKLLGGVDRTKYYEPALTAAQIAPAFAIPFDPTGVAASLAAKHMGINRLRVGLSHTESGKKFVDDLMRQGLDRGVKGVRSEYLPQSVKAQELFTDTIISPAVRDPQKIVGTLGSISRENPRAGARLNAAMDDLITGGKGQARVGRELQAFDALPDEQKVEKLLDLRDSLSPDQLKALTRRISGGVPRSVPKELRPALDAGVTQLASTPREKIRKLVTTTPSMRVEGELRAGVQSTEGLKGV